MSAADSQTRARVLARARRQGSVLRSVDLSSALALWAAVSFLLWFSGGVVARFSALMSSGLAAAADPEPALAVLLRRSGEALTPVWFLLGALVLSAMFSVLVQSLWGGSSVASRPGGLRLRRPFALVPGAGSGLVMVFWAVKGGILCLVVGQLFIAHTPALVGAMSGGIAQLVAALGSLARSGGRSLLFVVLLFAGLDMLVQRQRQLASLRVDPFEERRRRRAEEGDPRVRGQLAAQMKQGARGAAPPPASINAASERPDTAEGVGS